MIYVVTNIPCLFLKSHLNLSSSKFNSSSLHTRTSTATNAYKRRCQSYHEPWNWMSIMKGSQHQDELLLFDDESLPETLQTRIIHKVIGKTCQTTQDLAKHLPTGTVLVFQLMSPIVTREGNCDDSVALYLTATLVAVCGLSCFLLCFTDSFRDKNGVVCYGIVTFRGIWVIDTTVAEIPPKFAEKYRLQLIDFVHGFMSVLVFAVVVLFDKNMVQCFWPAPTDQIQKLLTALPIMISGICATLFAVFPTKRHGIGFPLSEN